MSPGKSFGRELIWRNWGNQKFYSGSAGTKEPGNGRHHSKAAEVRGHSPCPWLRCSAARPAVILQLGVKQNLPAALHAAQPCGDDVTAHWARSLHSCSRAEPSRADRPARLGLSRTSGKDLRPPAGPGSARPGVISAPGGTNMAASQDGRVWAGRQVFPQQKQEVEVIFLEKQKQQTTEAGKLTLSF